MSSLAGREWRHSAQVQEDRSCLQLQGPAGPDFPAVDWEQDFARQRPRAKTHTWPPAKNLFEEISYRRSVRFSGTLRPRMRSRATLRHAQNPADRLKIHLTDVWIAPRFFGMAQRGIEHAPFAVHFRPRHSKVMVRAVNSRVVFIIQLRGVQAEQHVDFVAGPLFR